MESSSKKDVVKKMKDRINQKAKYSEMEKLKPSEGAVEAFRRKPYSMKSEEVRK